MIDIPLWMTDTEAVGPCPCGNPPSGDVIIVSGEGEDGLKRWFHEQCMDWLTFELDEAGFNHMNEWRKRRRENKA